MDVGLRSPLVDAFRRADVPKEVRMDAAAGLVAPRGQEQLALFALLVDDPDERRARDRRADARGDSARRRSPACWRAPTPRPI